MGMTLNEGDAVTNWDPVKGINKTVSRIITETSFECNTAAESGCASRPNLFPPARRD